MIVSGNSSLAQLQQISVFQDLSSTQLKSLIPYSYIRDYQIDEIVMLEGDILPQKLHCLVTGTLEIKKTADNGKETVIRLIPPGEIFAAPAIFGNGIAPATAICQTKSQVLTIEKNALLQAIAESPEISLKILQIFNRRLQQLHNTVHGLISERAIIRLVKLIEYYSDRYGTYAVAEGDCLKIKLPYSQIARSIGISYEECVRLFKKLKEILVYRRGGTIIIRDRQKLAQM